MPALDREHLLRMAQVGLVGYMVCGTFLRLAYFDLFYHLLAIAVIAKLLVNEHYRTTGKSARVGTRQGQPLPRKFAAPAPAQLA